MQLNRKDLEARYEMFDRFALNDQRRYYRRTIEKYRRAGTQVNRWRALFALLTGLAAAAAGLLVQTTFLGSESCPLVSTDFLPFVEGISTAEAEIITAQVAGQAEQENQTGVNCGLLRFLTSALAFMAIAFPAFGGLFNTLADLYQWDRMITIYDAALENIEVADALSPVAEMNDDALYWGSLRAYAEGTLSVMSDESTQWGQSIRTPKQLEAFVSAEKLRAAKLSGDDGSISEAVGDYKPQFRDIARDEGLPRSNPPSPPASDVVEDDSDGPPPVG